MFRITSIALLIAVLATFLSGCSPRIAPPSHSVEQKLLKQFEIWRGTPYRLGGESSSGVDCSSFIMIVYRDAFGVQLPRSTDEQLRTGRRIAHNRLAIGDIMFFQTGRNTKHAGIVMGNGMFMHASTSRGVVMEHMNNPYWVRNFIGARRVL